METHEPADLVRVDDALKGLPFGHYSSRNNKGKARIYQPTLPLEK